MKKIFSLFILLLILLSLLGCANNDFLLYNSKKYVNLYNYSKEKIEYSETQITNEDVKSIITAEMSVNEAYIEVKNKKQPEIDDIVLLSIDGEEEYYTISGEKEAYELENKLLNINVEESFQYNDFNAVTLLGIYRNAKFEDTNFILSYYGYSTFEELERFIRERASEEIIFNYIFDKIYEKSKILSYPDDIREQIDFDIQNAKKQLSEQKIEFNDYLQKEEMTEEDFYNSISANYYDLVLYKAILDNENIQISKSEINKYCEKHSLSEENNIYDIYKLLSYEKIRKILISKVEIIK